jgi:hypothetical protein
MNPWEELRARDHIACYQYIVNYPKLLRYWTSYIGMIKAIGQREALNLRAILEIFVGSKKLSVS